MDISQLAKATKIYEQVKALDKEINEIDKIAMLLANGEVKSSFELVVEDIKKQKEESEKITLDADGSLPGNMMGRLDGGIYWHIKNGGWGELLKANKDNKHYLKCDLSESLSLQILGVLLCQKKEMRRVLIEQLEELGLKQTSK